MTMFLFDGWTLLTVLGVFAIWNSVRYPFDMSSPPTCSRGLVNFSASELKRLNCQPGSRLMPSTYLRCVELGILRRSRYVHRGSRSSCPVPLRRELYTASSFEIRFGNASSVNGYLKHD